MATENQCIKDGSNAAAADLSTHQYKAVKYTAAKTVNLTTAAGEACLGILQNDPLTGQPAEVVTFGQCMAKAGAAIAAGAKVMAGADGRVITAATSGSICIGWAKEAAGAANDIISINLQPSGIIP